MKILNLLFMDPYFYHSSLLQTILVVYSLVIFTCNGSSLSHYDECSALFQFKQSIIHQDDVDCAASWSQTFHSWNPTSNASNVVSDCCLWYGVECNYDHEYGHVIGLDLSKSSLCGNINSTSTLFNLVHLQSLDLSMNYFKDSQIPSEIAHLKKLRILNLSDSGFSGQVPNEISNLMQLSSLDLSWNSLKLQSCRGLKNLLTNLTGLEELHLSRVEISSFIPHFLPNFSSLRSIKLYNCSLKNEFPSAILDIPNLKILDVSSNLNLTGSLPEYKNNSLLEHVDLSGCSFSVHIPHSLSNLTQLSVLALGSNKFTGFVPPLVSLSKLKVLELDGSKFENGRLPNWLVKLTELNILRVSEMNITGKISPFLENLTKLGVLDMGENFLIGHTLSELFNLTQLRVLDIHQNQLKGPISSSFSKLKNLQCLHLGSNNFNGRVDLDMFLGLNKLKNFILNDNMLSLEATTNYTSSTFPEFKLIGLSNCNLQEFPVFLRFQNRMKLLSLSDNKIDGMVPVWIWNNNKETLREIDLSNNSINDFHKHPQYLPWERLRTFLMENNQVRGQLPIPPQTTFLYDVSDNHLTGEITPSICELKSLRILILSSNNMSGTLPPCFGNLSNSLVILDLSRNNFHGIMMNAFLHGSMLKSINLSKNRFTGQLPRSLTNCTNLMGLSLGDNSFNDIFPSWLGTIAYLRVLVLRSNKLYGPIQGLTTICSQFPKLQVLDLSNNGFTGQLHKKYFQTWNISMHENMSGINVLSKNEFRGLLPRSLINCTNLEVISLGDNSFSDVFPSWLGMLPKLQVLVLRSNKFHGPIQGSTTAISQFPKLRIIDLSNNRLSGELHGKYFQTWNAMKSVSNGTTSIYRIQLTLINKGVRTEYEYILNILTVIDISCNHFEGKIPLSLQVLQGLHSLKISNNHFTGDALPSFWYLKNLESLDLSLNGLFGEIPQQLVQLSFLSIFNVSFNHLHGRIPQGGQFNTFDNDSYKGNPQLCGKPLSEECEGSKALRLPPATNTFESLLPLERIDWIFIFV